MSSGASYGVGEAALARVHLHRRDAEVQVDQVGRTPSSRSSAKPVGVVHAQEAGLAGRLARELLEALLGGRVAVDADERARRAEPVGHQARVAAARRRCSPRRSRPRRGSVRSISSPASTGTCVRVMSRRMAKALRHLLDLRRPGCAARPPTGRVPTPRGGPLRPRRRPPSRSRRAPRSGGGSVTRPAESSSMSNELPWKKRESLRCSGPIGFRPAEARAR